MINTDFKVSSLLKILFLNPVSKLIISLFIGMVVVEVALWISSPKIQPPTEKKIVLDETPKPKMIEPKKVEKPDIVMSCSAKFAAILTWQDKTVCVENITSSGSRPPDSDYVKVDIGRFMVNKAQFMPQDMCRKIQAKKPFELAEYRLPAIEHLFINEQKVSINKWVCFDTKKL